MKQQRRSCMHSRIVRKLRRFVKRVFGVNEEFGRAHRAGRVHAFFDGLFDLVVDAEGSAEIASKGALKDFIKAAMRVRKVNQKLIGFERGVSLICAFGLPVLIPQPVHPP
jgi:hypothetical protein